jgi:hypothetical protein
VAASATVAGLGLRPALERGAHEEDRVGAGGRGQQGPVVVEVPLDDGGAVLAERPGGGRVGVAGERADLVAAL